MLEARADAKATRANLYPFVSADPSVSRTRTSGTRPAPPGAAASPSYGNTISLPVDASYEVDLWGRIRRSVESATAQVQVRSPTMRMCCSR